MDHEASFRRKEFLWLDAPYGRIWSAQDKVLKKENVGGVEQITQLQAICKIIMLRNLKSHFPKQGKGGAGGYRQPMLLALAIKQSG